MSSLDEPDDDTDTPGTETQTETGGETTVTVSIPDDATEAETAAISAAISAHITDRQRAAAAARWRSGRSETHSTSSLPCPEPPVDLFSICWPSRRGRY